MQTTVSLISISSQILLNPVKTLLCNVETCCFDIKKWMSFNMLKLNNSKTDVRIFGTPVQLKNCTIESVKIVDSEIKPSPKVKSIGAMLDTGLEMVPHINMITSSPWFHLRNISRIRKSHGLTSTHICDF